MISSKELTLEEILKEMSKLKYRLLELGDKLKIGVFEIRAIEYKDVITKSSYVGDVMLNKMIKADGTREEFDAVKESYNGYRQLAIEKIGEMIETKPVEECIVYFRDHLHWKWDEIARMFNYTSRHCRNLYNNEKKK